MIRLIELMELVLARSSFWLPVGLFDARKTGRKRQLICPPGTDELRMQSAGRRSPLQRGSASTSNVITPEQGMALLFHHPIMHRGDPVTRGRKYVLRSDVMYRRQQ
ncbi:MULTISPECIES: hypothetical protein [unclassified Bradyrhizobium]|uniref:hypothetical protein n=1 Tax=unclassified Bradyrhizobium TaxID=2631580 RepID=UPI0028E812A7|nr:MULTISPECIES: hypothetical protein [unclassified Bradyrhizobium]